MLILTRKPDQSVVIRGDEPGSEIVISVCASERNGQVRLGITAPRRYRIYRGELLDEVRHSNRNAMADQAAADLIAGLRIGTRTSATAPGADSGKEKQT
ncbi:MAG: carbon storage regulator [Planctomycetota bacterium]